MTKRAAESPVATASEHSPGCPATAGEVLSEYLHAQAGDFLRSLRLHGESGADIEEAAEAARLLRRAARRISGALSVYRPITDTAWSDQLRAELAWLSGTLALEHAYAGRLARLRDALHRLSGAGGPPDRTPPGDAAAGEPAATGVDAEAVGASGPTTIAVRTARGGVTAGIDGPRSSRTARRSVSLATGTPDPAPRAPRGGASPGPGPEETAEAPGRPAARPGSGGATEPPRRPYEQYEQYEQYDERNADAAPPGADAPAAAGTHGPGTAGAGAPGGGTGAEAPGLTAGRADSARAPDWEAGADSSGGAGARRGGAGAGGRDAAGVAGSAEGADAQGRPGRAAGAGAAVAGVTGAGASGGGAAGSADASGQTAGHAESTGAPGGGAGAESSGGAVTAGGDGAGDVVAGVTGGGVPGGGADASGQSGRADSAGAPSRGAGAGGREAAGAAGSADGTVAPGRPGRAAGPGAGGAGAAWPVPEAGGDVVAGVTGGGVPGGGADASGQSGRADSAGAPSRGAGAGGREAAGAAGHGAGAAWPVPDGAGDVAAGATGGGAAGRAEAPGETAGRADSARAPGREAGAELSGGAGAPGRGADVGGREPAGTVPGRASGRAGRARGVESSRARTRGGGGAEERRTAAHQRAGDPEEARGGALTVGAARAGALLERQLTLARTRAHTAALQALGSSRFHAVADTVALLASEVPLDEATAGRPAEQVLPPLAELANRRLFEAVEALPLGRAGHPYNAEALVHGLAATPAADSPPASDRQDAPWRQVRRLVRMRRYALEVLDLMAARPAATDAEPSQATRLEAAGQALERHRDAAEAAAAAAAAARTPRIAPATAYALGVLHADQRHAVEAARFAFGRMWRRVVGQAS